MKEMEIRRSKVKELIDEASDEKLILSKTDDVIDLFKKAAELCDVEPKVIEPWPSLIAYRHAHLLMRLCSRKNNLKKSDLTKMLTEADRLFTKSSRQADLLGPLPSIYRLAVLQRLQATDKNDVSTTTINNAFKIAIDNFEKSFAVTSTSAQLQNGWFNLLEIASYFLALPYSKLEGKGKLLKDKDLFKDKSWVIIGPDPESMGVRMHREIALSEIESRIKENPDSFFYILPHKDSKEEIRKWRYGINDNWKKIESYEPLRLLAILCAKKNNSIKDVKTAYRNANDDVAFRAAKTRLKKEFQKLTGLEENEIFAGLETPSGVPIVTDKIKIFGAVEYRALSRN